MHKTKRHTNEKKKHHHSKEGTKCSNCNKNRRTQTSQPKLKKKCKEPSNNSLSDLLSNTLRPAAHTLFPLIFSHHIPLLSCHSPSMVRKKGFCLLRQLSFQAPNPLSLPQENLPDTANTVNKGNPATLSYPNTHPSFLGREGPWACGNSKLLAQAPNPREGAPPPRLTNPAR